MEKSLTVEKLRTFPGFENTPDDIALRIVTDLNKLADVAIRVYLKQQRKQKKSETDSAIDS